jgi:flagellar basal-body rod protein FlgC
MSLFPEMDITATGLQAERMRLEVIARNIANANTTRTENGDVFRRQLVSLISQTGDPEQGIIPGVEIAGLVTDPSPLKTIYDPGHPDADANGYVSRPNVDVMLEMVDMLGASRAYEANISAIQSAKDMARRAMDI